MPTPESKFTLLRRIHTVERYELAVKQAEEAIAFLRNSKDYEDSQLLENWTKDLDRRRHALEMHKENFFKAVKDASVPDESSAAQSG